MPTVVRSLLAGAALVGFGTKAGLMPLHSWLPQAHPAAHAHVSALMSGMMIKVALYGLVRMLFEWLAPLPGWVAPVLLGAAALSCVAGVLYALACWQSLAGDTDSAIASLVAAIQAQPKCVDWAKDDADLDAIRGLPGSPI